MYGKLLKLNRLVRLSIMALVGFSLWCVFISICSNEWVVNIAMIGFLAYYVRYTQRSIQNFDILDSEEDIKFCYRRIFLPSDLFITVLCLFTIRSIIVCYSLALIQYLLWLGIFALVYLVRIYAIRMIILNK